jgi:hypothetical protein
MVVFSFRMKAGLGPVAKLRIRDVRRAQMWPTSLVSPSTHNLPPFVGTQGVPRVGPSSTQHRSAGCRRIGRSTQALSRVLARRLGVGAARGLDL